MMGASEGFWCHGFHLSGVVTSPRASSPPAPPYNPEPDKRYKVSVSFDRTDAAARKKVINVETMSPMGSSPLKRDITNCGYNRATTANRSVRGVGKRGGGAGESVRQSLTLTHARTRTDGRTMQDAARATRPEAVCASVTGSCH
ncbi:hypothetical protein J6590_023727 [Homalodisca vitripennis]|nr:hypothetical protein J6590_023727 [Homalodisca vitripennis]